MSKRKIEKYPAYVGYWWIFNGKVEVSTKTKPGLWKRFWFWFFFGAEWRKGEKL